MWIPNERTDELIERWAKEIVEAVRDAIDENGRQLAVEVRFISCEMADRVTECINEKYHWLELSNVVHLHVVN